MRTVELTNTEDAGARVDELEDHHLPTWPNYIWGTTSTETETRIVFRTRWEDRVFKVLRFYLHLQRDLQLSMTPDEFHNAWKSEAYRTLADGVVQHIRRSGK